MKILSGALAALSTLTILPAAPAVISYAAISDCAKDSLTEEYCGSWWYRTTDGKRHPLKGVASAAEPVAASGDGRRLAYLRAKDTRLVIRDLDGRTRTSKSKAWPSNEELDVTRVTMSHDGSLVAVNCCWAGNTQHRARVYNAATGALLVELPGVSVNDDSITFSGDSDQALVMTEDLNSITASVYDLDGARTLAAKLPKAIAATATAAALHADGHTIAFYLSGRAPKIALYDLRSGLVTTTFPAPPSGQPIEDHPLIRKVEIDTEVRLDWTGDTTVRMLRELGPKTLRVQVYGIDVTAGTVKAQRAYAITATAEEAVSGR
ncbi:hypothetical protein OIE66_00725 [Nonomuraea sp. NBC_01738]|uniref:WD40 repeat domain-containing protein n=1 Tax=Nonomuraea sp. NBC_01738 TaxID=2976003 RepID=UPI002E13DC06|nr:hypothetical protein OIE66_00725 [Nonomuraea sp. NBC_01738]